MNAGQKTRYESSPSSPEASAAAERGLTQDFIRTPADPPNSEPSLTLVSYNEEKDEMVENAKGRRVQDQQAEEKNEINAGDANLDPRIDERPYSIFTHNEKKVIVICAGLCAFFSPISSNIYFPSLDTISKDLKVSYSLVNLTITTYMASIIITIWDCANFGLDHARSCTSIRGWLLGQFGTKANLHDLFHSLCSRQSRPEHPK